VERGWCGGGGLEWDVKKKDRTAVAVTSEQQRSQKRKTGRCSGGSQRSGVGEGVDMSEDGGAANEPLGDRA
jgi:hypothetical protein